MGRPVFKVERRGLLTTIQDRGRFGHQHEGMTVAGAMDGFASQIANLLVGNRRGEAVLETTLIGPTLTVLQKATIALCGADLSAQIDGVSLALWKTARVYAGQILTFGRRVSGARIYLAVSGGFDVPMVQGSRSTFLRGKLGGLEGRALQAGDILACGNSAFLPPRIRSLRPDDVPVYANPATLRYLPGPHVRAFTRRGRHTFAQERYTVTPQSDRMGCRLAGPIIERANDDELLSEAMPPGAIQIPPNCQPIVLMADRQTVGGYSLIGVVCTVDLPRLAQCAPGDTIQFQPITLAQAQKEWIDQERLLHLLELVNLTR